MAGDKRSYYRLFGGYVLASLATGIATVGLAVVAFRLVGDEAAAAGVIGAALAIKMLAYVVGAPLAAAFLGGARRRTLMVGLDLGRAGALLALPFATTVWQLYGLILLFALASAAFAPTYQAVVPRLLPDRAAYASSLSRSRVAGELEGAISPALAAGLIATVGVVGLFLGAMTAFLLSAALIAAARLPDDAPDATAGALGRLADGFGALFREPALIGLAPLALAVGAASATVTVDTAPIVMGRLGRGPDAAAWALAAFGAGSAAGALALPALLRAVPERTLMLAGAAGMTAALAASRGVSLYPTLLLLWTGVGAGAALALAPAGALIRGVAAPEDRQVVYAAHLSTTNAAAGLGYAGAAALGATQGLDDGTVGMAAVAGAATLLAAGLWSRAARRRRQASAAGCRESPGALPQRNISGPDERRPHG